MSRIHFPALTGLAGMASMGAMAALLAGCATGPSEAELDRQALAAVQASFRDQGIAKLDRIKQDLGQAACSTDKPPSEAVAERIAAEARAAVKWPAGGQYFGDFREGERIAQSGRGMTWTDTSTAASANGGNCYNCHQISKQEISHGTIGPSLYNYGKIRGVVVQAGTDGAEGDFCLANLVAVVAVAAVGAGGSTGVGPGHATAVLRQLFAFAPVANELAITGQLDVGQVGRFDGPATCFWQGLTCSR